MTCKEFAMLTQKDGSGTSLDLKEQALDHFRLCSRCRKFLAKVQEAFERMADQDDRDFVEAKAEGIMREWSQQLGEVN